MSSISKDTGVYQSYSFSISPRVKRKQYVVAESYTIPAESTDLVEKYNLERDLTSMTKLFLSIDHIMSGLDEKDEDYVGLYYIIKIILIQRSGSVFREVLENVPVDLISDRLWYAFNMFGDWRSSTGPSFAYMPKPALKRFLKAHGEERMRTMHWDEVRPYLLMRGDNMSKKSKFYKALDLA